MLAITFKGDGIYTILYIFDIYLYEIDIHIKDDRIHTCILQDPSVTSPILIVAPRSMLGEVQLVFFQPYASTFRAFPPQFHHSLLDYIFWQ